MNKLKQQITLPPTRIARIFNDQRFFWPLVYRTDYTYRGLCHHPDFLIFREVKIRIGRGFSVHHLYFCDKLTIHCPFEMNSVIHTLNSNDQHRTERSTHHGIGEGVAVTCGAYQSGISAAQPSMPSFACIRHQIYPSVREGPSKIVMVSPGFNIFCTLLAMEG